MHVTIAFISNTHPHCAHLRFIVAGHETTSVATTWCLFALTQAPDVQRRLRAELLALDTDTPDMDALNALPYLDMVIRETLRVHPPVTNTLRVAVRDDVIPLDVPFVDARGEVQYSIRCAAPRHVRSKRLMCVAFWTGLIRGRPSSCRSSR